MKTSSQILQDYENKNEYHFHEVDRKWIIEAMDEYAKQQFEYQKNTYAELIERKIRAATWKAFMQFEAYIEDENAIDVLARKHADFVQTLGFRSSSTQKNEFVIPDVIRRSPTEIELNKQVKLLGKIKTKLKNKIDKLENGL